MIGTVHKIHADTLVVQIDKTLRLFQASPSYRSSCRRSCFRSASAARSRRSCPLCRSTTAVASEDPVPCATESTRYIPVIVILR